MAKLEIDFDVLNATINDYQTSIDGFKETLNSLNGVVENLQKKGWNSAAGEKYRQKKQTWEENLKKHIVIITHLRECLLLAKKEYTDIYDQVSALGSDL